MFKLENVLEVNIILEKNPKTIECRNIDRFLKDESILLKNLSSMPWLVAQWNEGQPVKQRVAVQFPARAHARVASQVPSSGCMRGNHTLMFLSLLLPFPL